MAILKVIEILASSNTSWEDATAGAVAEASKTLNNISSVYVQDMSATVKDGKVDEYRVNLKITFKLER
jgi:dodecin